MLVSHARTEMSDADPAAIASAWFAHLAATTLAAMPFEVPVPRQPHAVLAAFVAIALAQGRSVLILMPDDEALPEVSAALDLAIRPLCLVLPAADFAARIALRATLSLMRSRLVRDDEETLGPGWLRQRQRIDEHPTVWKAAQGWAARDDRSDWPDGVAELFPVRVLPIAAYRGLRQENADLTLLFRCDAPAELIVSPGSLVRVGTRTPAPRARAVVASDQDTRLRAELAQLTRDVGEMELELATAQAEVAEFTRSYYSLVGRRMVELDALQARLAQHNAEAASGDAVAAAAAAQEHRARAEQSAHDAERFAAADGDEAEFRRPGEATKRLFRRVAQQIHPDRALDEADRAWRTQLMAEANRAYRAGDDVALREVESLWREGRSSREDTGLDEPGAATGVSRTPTLVRQVEAMRDRLTAIQRELQALFGSRLYELFLAARHARRQGRDLLAEMATKLEATIRELTDRLASVS